MAKKQINTEFMANELSEGSAFFNQKPESKVSQPIVMPEPKPAIDEKPTTEDPKLAPTVSTEVTPEPISQSSTDVTTSRRNEVNYRELRDIIENTETRSSSLRLTNNEVFAVEDLVKELERNLRIKTSINEVARLGLLYMINDFKKNGDKSLIYKVKKS